MPRVITLDSFNVPSRLKEKCQEITVRLTAGEISQGMHVERLSGKRSLLSIRLNKRDRLLVHAFSEQGERCYLLLTILEHHRYDKNPFVFDKRFLSQHLAAQQEEIAAKLQCSIESVLAIGEDDITTLDFYNKQLLAPSHLQQLTLDALAKDITKAKLLLGPPGSGKTWLAKMLMEGGIEAEGGQEYVSASLNKRNRIIYVAPTERLAKQMDAIFHDPQQNERQEVRCLTYQQLLEQVLSLEEELVDDEHLLSWLGHYIQLQKRVMRTLSLEDRPPTVVEDREIDRIFNEFNIISGYDESEAYLSCGSRQSYYVDSRDRQWLYDAFLQYQAALTADSKIHLRFYRVDKSYADMLLIVDEAQALSFCQLRALHTLSAGQCIFMADPNQYLSGHITNIDFIKSHLVEKEQCYCLDNTSHRCACEIVQVANNVLALRSSVFGGNIDGAALASLSENPMNGKGMVGYYSSVNNLLETHTDTAFDQASCAIVTLAEFREEARSTFNNPLVFTVEEIGGLDYQTLVLYKLFDSGSVKYLTKYLQEGMTLSPKANLPKNTAYTMEQQQMVAILNQWFVACSRARSQLFMVQHVNKRSQVLFTTLLANTQALADESAAYDSAKPYNAPLTDKMTSQEQLHQWLEQYHRLSEQGRIAQANEVMSTKIRPLQTSIAMDNNDLEKQVVVASLLSDKGASPASSISLGSCSSVQSKRVKPYSSKVKKTLETAFAGVENPPDEVDLGKYLFEKVLTLTGLTKSKIKKSIKMHFQAAKKIKNKNEAKKWLKTLAKMLEIVTASADQRLLIGNYFCENFKLEIKVKGRNINGRSDFNSTYFTLPYAVISAFFQLSKENVEVIRLLVQSRCLEDLFLAFESQEFAEFICLLEECQLGDFYKILRDDGAVTTASEIYLIKMIDDAEYDKVRALLQRGVRVREPILKHLVTRHFHDEKEEKQAASLVGLLIKQGDPTFSRAELTEELVEITELCNEILIEARGDFKPIINNPEKSVYDEAVHSGNKYLACELKKFLSDETLKLISEEAVLSTITSAVQEGCSVVVNDHTVQAIDVGDSQAQTELLMAARNLEVAKIRTLIESGAKLDACTENGEDAVILVLKNDLDNSHKQAAIIEILVLLAMSGAPCYHPDRAEFHQLIDKAAQHVVYKRVYLLMLFSEVIREEFKFFLKSCAREKIVNYLNFINACLANPAKVLQERILPAIQEKVYQGLALVLAQGQFKSEANELARQVCAEYSKPNQLDKLLVKLVFCSDRCLLAGNRASFFSVNHDAVSNVTAEVKRGSVNIFCNKQ